MLQIESFDYYYCDNIKSTTDQVNNRIKELNRNGIVDIKIDITTTGHGVVYTLIYR